MSIVSHLMNQFAERTGLTGGGPQRRYLWTDAFAVCNFVALGRFDMAAETVNRVHATLGCYRDDDRRTGRLDGGLRIGKPLPERGPGEPLDERLEWDRDGQYFHYLTKWVHALDVMTRVTGAAVFATAALDLIRAAHRGFVHVTPHGKRMYWKMSTDLTRPLVTSMGHHDPLDGLITSIQVGAPQNIVDDFRSMVDPSGLATSDPLGLGGLLCDAHRVDELVREGVWPRDLPLYEVLVAAAQTGLRHFAASRDLDGSAHRRLAFRELGLSIGLAAAALLPGDPFAKFIPLRNTIEAFWIDPAHRHVRTWTEHADINDVMLATSLLPQGFLLMAPRESAGRAAAGRSAPPHRPTSRS